MLYALLWYSCKHEACCALAGFVSHCPILPNACRENLTVIFNSGYLFYSCHLHVRKGWVMAADALFLRGSFETSFKHGFHRTPIHTLVFIYLNLQTPVVTHPPFVEDNPSDDSWGYCLAPATPMAQSSELSKTSRCCLGNALMAKCKQWK